LGIAYSQSSKPPQPAIQSGTNGRYQIVMNPEFARNTFLLDTQTGKIWQLTQFSDLEDDPMAWLAQTKLDSDQELFTFAQKHKSKKQP
jgi:hypothetical protein